MDSIKYATGRDPPVIEHNSELLSWVCCSCNFRQPTKDIRIFLEGIHDQKHLIFLFIRFIKILRYMLSSIIILFDHKCYLKLFIAWSYIYRYLTRLTVVSITGGKVGCSPSWRDACLKNLIGTKYQINYSKFLGGRVWELISCVARSFLTISAAYI